MKKIIIILIAIFVLGVGYWLISPFFIDKVVNESAPAQSVGGSQQEIASGAFTGFDSVHQGQGTAKLIRSGGVEYIRFEDDFSVTNGPDLFVGFGKDGKYIKGSEISALKGNKGSQNYELPGVFDSSKYNEVWIWCKAFSVPFAKASLR